MGRNIQLIRDVWMGGAKPVEQRKDDVSNIQKSLPCNKTLKPGVVSPIGWISPFNTTSLAEVMYEVSSGVGMCGKTLNTAVASKKAIDIKPRIAKSPFAKLTLMGMCQK